MASDQGETAILFIHGILGTTKHFETFFIACSSKLVNM